MGEKSFDVRFVHEVDGGSSVNEEFKSLTVDRDVSLWEGVGMGVDSVHVDGPGVERQIPVDLGE
jgi:hypothetical protein